jgi:hypothetical protein
MATYQQLQDSVARWLNRRDIGSDIPDWVLGAETEMAQTLRARCMVKSATQAVDANYITLPPDFATMESIRDANSGELLELKDEWSGHWNVRYTGQTQIVVGAPATAYRLVHDCVEFLPHPQVPDPPDPNWAPQQVLMGWYARPKPLLLPADTNPVLDQLYLCYLYGVLKHGAIFEMDDDRAQQMDALWQQQVTRANLHKQQSDYSGAPYRAEMAVVF